ncbi:hypothetical protein CCP3SC5AM1_1720002 [Gammaproteobacteria bacterium]
MKLGFIGQTKSSSFYNALIEGFKIFNPHLTINDDAALSPAWNHWPAQETSPHWYTNERFRDLLALRLKADQCTTINEFIREFHGLSGTQKAKSVLAHSGLTGKTLQDLLANDDFDMGLISTLLEAMKQGSRQVKPEALGVIGRDNFHHHLISCGIGENSIEYRKATGIVNGLPYVLEVAFGVFNSDDAGRMVRAGINWTPVLGIPFDELNEAMRDARIDHEDGVALIVHLACPVIHYRDRGKTKAFIPMEMGRDMERMVRLATKKFTEAKDRNRRISRRDWNELLTRHKEKNMSVKSAAALVMQEAYFHASGGGNLPANARQIMYAARPRIIELTGKTSPWKNSATFTQRLLPDYLMEHSEECHNWDVVFDDRGHFEEPHTRIRIGIGTLAVRNHIHDWHDLVDDRIDNIRIPDEINTKGPVLRYRYALFIEKEGFDSILRQANIANRFDIAIFSTKGMSTTAARMLVENMSNHGVTILVLHDFDKSGFTIAHTIKSNGRRYQFRKPPKVVDLGLRLDDIVAMNLTSEEVEYGKNDPRPKLKEQGATQAEADFLVTKSNFIGNQWYGRRVELNAMDSPRFIAWLEEKLRSHGVGRFIPPNDKDLRTAFIRAQRVGNINRTITATIKNCRDDILREPPNNLRDLIQKNMGEGISWDQAVATIARSTP